MKHWDFELNVIQNTHIDTHTHTETQHKNVKYK